MNAYFCALVWYHFFMKLRGLDVDDFLILALLGDGYSVTKTAAHLNLTQPAVTQRIRKMENFLGFKIVYRTGRGVLVSKDAITMSIACKKALIILMHSLPNLLSNGRSNSLIDYMLRISRDGIADESYDS